MRGTLLAIACAAILGMCGCAVDGSSANDVAQDPVEEDVLELDDSGTGGAVSDIELPVNPSGKTEVGCALVGLPYSVGPVMFNCPPEFVVVETTDDHLELNDLDRLIAVSANVTYGERYFPDADNAEEAMKAHEDALRESNPEGFAMRWCEYYPECIMASFTAQHTSNGRMVDLVAAYIYAKDGYTASLTVAATSDKYSQYEDTMLDIADTLRIN